MERPFISVRGYGIAPTHAGKVREILALNEKLLIITTDRVSAFDCVLPDPIPGKGKLLNRISTYWFHALDRIMPSHWISDSEERFPSDLGHLHPFLKDRWVLVRKASRIDVECVVRGYLAGSGMREYHAQGTVGGIEVPDGIAPFGELPEPLFTPTTKEDTGHDRPVTFAQLIEAIGEELSRRLRSLSLELYRIAARHARARGLILVDTKFEFGWIDGELVLIDELLTPDSSRYWPVSGYGSGEPLSLDKEYLRDYLAGLDWDKNPPAPALPAEQIAETYRRYRMVYDMLDVDGETPRLGKEGQLV